MIRHLLTVLSVISLLLGAATAVVSVFYDGHRLTYTLGAGPASSRRTIGIAVGGGYVQPWVVQGDSGWTRGLHGTVSGNRFDRYGRALKKGEFAGVRWYRASARPAMQAAAAVAYALQVPLGFVVSILVAPPLLWMASCLSRRRQGDGTCLHCDYDLTGNVSGVCPECGTMVSKSAEAQA